MRSRNGRCLTGDNNSIFTLAAAASSDICRSMSRRHSMKLWVRVMDMKSIPTKSVQPAGSGVLLPLCGSAP